MTSLPPPPPAGGRSGRFSFGEEERGSPTRV